MDTRRLTIPSLPVSTTSYEFIGDLANANGEAFFLDGSRYRGTWDALGMAGVGSYVMPHAVLYEGQIRDGVQHGIGSLRYPGKQIIDGVWNRGGLEKLRYTFSDGLVFEKENWNYCRFPDRRYYRSKMKGLNPAGRSLKSQDQPTKIIPLGCYDSADDGIFDPSTLCVMNFGLPSKIVRIPSAKEAEWIMKHCRKGGTEPTGYQPWLNENWSSHPPARLPYRLPMSNDSPERWWKRIFTFDKYSDAILNERRRRLERGEDRSSREEKRSDVRPDCFCRPEEPQSETESGYNVCGEPDLCGDKHFQESSASEFDILREVVCEEMTYSEEEYEGEDTQDLLMTVCCPPEATVTTRRRLWRESRKSLNSAKEDEEEKEGEEDEGEGKEAEEGEGNEFTEESEVEEAMEDFWKGNEQENESVVIDSWEEEIEGEYDSEDFLPDEISREKLTKGEEEDFGLLIQEFSEELNERLKSKKRVVEKRKPGGTKKTGKVKKVGLKEQKKQPCPVLDETEQFLQRKVGDLLYSPALEAPRSPVLLVRKDCDKKSCPKSKPRNYKNSKCGVSSSPLNSSAKKRATKVCGDNKELKQKLYSENKNICSYSKPFVTVQTESPRN